MLFRETNDSEYDKCERECRLKENKLFLNTGFIILRDAKKELWYYHVKLGIMIPEKQDYITKAYKMYSVLPSENIDIQMGSLKKKARLVYGNEARDIFGGLSQIATCDPWNIKKRNWLLSAPGEIYSKSIYDGWTDSLKTCNIYESFSLLYCVGPFVDKRFQPDRSWWTIEGMNLKNHGFVPISTLETNLFFAKKVMQSEPAVKEDTTAQGKTVAQGETAAKTGTSTRQKTIKKAENTKGDNMNSNIKTLLDCDKRRCRLDSYEESMLYDIKKGHWDLFELSESEIRQPSGTGKLVSRDPRLDIKDGIVGIDFGTKSTVVVRQNDTNNIIPIRIGTGVLAAEVKEDDYENPTIIQCTDLKKFLEKYFEKKGRPDTSCEDFFVSYDALADYRRCKPDEFYAYYMELKQWANNEKQNVSVLDKQKQEYRFGKEKSKEEKVINPIELYAYYIGMYINNMRNGIYMNYLMSFPVGYSKETRQLILESFEKGIKKSLPATILNDEQCMKKFQVRLGISEPAAYAVTVLEMSDLDPKDETEKYMYGIFDFGGGTTDFDFGIWRGASEDEYEIEGYDYVLECFGADSDVTLGGENMLELLAYTVFKENREIARNKKLVCSLPLGERAFLGSEILISDSQIAKRNMSILKEALRPLWHQESGWKKRYRDESSDDDCDEKDYKEYIELTMYDINGDPQPNCRFVIDTNRLICQIKERIEKGIAAFFKCMEKTFRTSDEAKKQDKKVYIFLAGNASKSVFVKELFEKKIQEYYDKFKKMDETAGNSYFELIEPLKTVEEKDCEYVPNAKTGVAYGLIKSREGSSIKIVKNYETDANQETRFKFYLGRERRKKFECRLSPMEVNYGTWVRFQGAGKEVIRIYYTANPMADAKNEQLPIEDITYKEITIEPKNDAFLFIRTTQPSEIEYVVASSESEIDEKTAVKRILA